MVNEARYLAWNCELKTRLRGTVSHLHIRNNYRQIVTQQMQKGFISLSFPTEEVKGVNYFPSRANDLEFWKKIVIDKRVVNSVKYHYLSLRLVWSLFKKFENKCKNKHKLQIKLSKVQTCFLFPNAMTVLTAVDFEMTFLSARSG